MVTPIKKRMAAKLLAVTAICSALLSFSIPKGGEGFELYVGNKLILQQFGSELKEAKVVYLDQSYANQQLSVKYWHCGKAGKDRTITVKDGKDRLLKQWHFADVSNATPVMNCSIKEIFNLGASHGNTLKLYYSSSELKSGRLLASIEMKGKGSSISTVQPTNLSR